MSDKLLYVNFAVDKVISMLICEEGPRGGGGGSNICYIPSINWKNKKFVL